MRGLSCILVVLMAFLGDGALAQPAIGRAGVDGGFATESQSLSSGVAGRIVNPPGTTIEQKRFPILSEKVAITQPPKISEFQRFVLDATGKILPIYGMGFFSSESGVAPQHSGPVSADYPVGPGDELLIRGSGTIDLDYKAIVDRNGAINIPQVGTVTLVGTRAADVEEKIRVAIGKVFRGFSLNVSFGQLRGITVYVVGQAKRPGTYHLSSVSTAISALFESGGPGLNGSLRRVQIKRGSKQISEIDLYAFLAKGDKSMDVRLIDGDVIVIPPAAGYVALSGKLDTPAIYELRGKDDSVQSLLDVAGGLPVVADPRRAFLERVDPERNLPRSVEEFALDASGLKMTLRNGDLLSVLAITSEFSNAVTLRGSVQQALRVPYRQGMRVADLIPSKDYLIDKMSQKRRNRALVEQEAREQESRRATYRQETALIDKYQGDDKQRDDKQGEATSLLASIGNSYVDLNWDYAVVERANRKEMTEALVPFNLGKALSDRASPDNILLEAGDIVTVFSADDVRVPIAKRKVYVRIEGEVKRPGVYKVEAGETLVNMLERAGGVTQDAFLFGSEFYREAVRKSQQENLDKLVSRLEQQLNSDSARSVANVIATDASVQARLSAEAEARKQFVQRLRGLKSSGRLSLGLPAKDAQVVHIPEFRLENGDRLVVPNRPEFVQVFGAVATESAFLWQPGRSVSDYLAKAGLVRDADQGATFVIHADGTVVSNSDRWLSTVGGLEVLPGDVIVLPEKFDKESFWTAFARGAKDWTQIFANLGLGAAAIRTLR